MRSPAGTSAGAPGGLEGRVLVHAPFGRDGAALVNLARDRGHEARAVATSDQLLRAMDEGFGALVLTEEALGAGAGAPLAGALADQPAWSSAPVLALVSDAGRPPAGLAHLEALSLRTTVMVLQRPTPAASIGSALRTLLEMRARQRVIRDQIAEIEAQRNHQKFLLDELDHRVRNTLAKVRSIANMSARQSADPEVFRQVFAARIDALARVHDLLAGDRQQPVDLEGLVDGALAPFRSAGNANIRTRGPHLPLWPKAALTLGMALHELATNAAKHGALSTPGGRVVVEWAVRSDGDGTLELTWQETGGPPVRSPERRSFGRMLLEEVAPRDLNGSVELSFFPGGVRYRLDAPLPDGAVA